MPIRIALPKDANSGANSVLLPIGGRPSRKHAALQAAQFLEFGEKIVAVGEQLTPRR